MRTSMHFNIPEEHEEYLDCMNGSVYRSEIHDYANHLRSQFKYGINDEGLKDLIKVNKIKEEHVDIIIDFLRSKLYELCPKAFEC